MFVQTYTRWHYISQSKWV